MKTEPFQIDEILYPKDSACIQEFRNSPIYRFMGFESLEEILLSRAITLVKTKYWEDTYENFFFKSELILDEVPFDLTHVQERIFGSCWTKNRETDALWRIYSHNKCGVRVRSTIEKLAHSIQQEFHKSIAWSACIGEVRYVTLGELEKYAQEYSDEDFVAETGKFYKESMFIKRREFEHEDEIRIILRVKEEKFDICEVVPLHISPENVIEEITFDPRISDGLYNLFISKLRLIGYERIANKSDLYSQKRLEIRLKGGNDRFRIDSEE